jgi:ornithine carbamoyltransferase
VTKDLCSILDLSRDELQELFALTDVLKSGDTPQSLAGMTAALIFQKPSLRTRVSFEVGVRQLGGHPVVLSQEGIGLGEREPAKDVARLLSRYNDFIVARLFSHQLLLDLAHYASIPVINALTDESHPCQILADAYTIRERGKLQPGLKVAFIGDGNNVANSWLELCTLLPIHFLLSTPKGYEPNAGFLARCRDASVGRVDIVSDPLEAATDADVLYTDVWTSMGQEIEAAKRRTAFQGYVVDDRLLHAARPDCIFMHCLPAHRGEEVTESVMDGKHSVVFDQAENCLHVQKAILMMLADRNHKNMQKHETTVGKD